MPVKNPLGGKIVEVTFRMPPLDGVVELFLCGDFNNWHTAGAPLSREPDGSWSTTLELEAGRSYRYRYYDNQGRWHNDWEADSYVTNDFGSEDSVVDLSGVVPPDTSTTRAVAPKGRNPARKAPTKKAATKTPAPKHPARHEEVKKGPAGRKPKKAI